MNLDQQFMKLAIEQAKKANNLIGSNPFVGAVVTNGEVVIATGYHKRYGGKHAEIIALDKAGDKARGATIYISLEPCTHQGKTAPCVKRVIESGVSRVVIGSLDPNPLVAGRSIKILEAHGVDVEVGVLNEECLELNLDFFKYIEHQIPYVTMKSAISLDGRIATKTGDSRGISGNQAAEYTQSLRNSNQAIMVGVNTVIADNPKLTCRVKDYNSPQRIVVDSKLRTPIDSQVVLTAKLIPTMIVTTVDDFNLHQQYTKLGVDLLVVAEKQGRVDLKLMLVQLGQLGIKSILLEPGATLAASFINQRLVDKFIMYIAPKLIGGLGVPVVGDLRTQLITEAIELTNPDIKVLGNDILLTTKFIGGSDVYWNS